MARTTNLPVLTDQYAVRGPGNKYKFQTPGQTLDQQDIYAEVGGEPTDGFYPHIRYARWGGESWLELRLRFNEQAFEDALEALPSGVLQWSHGSVVTTRFYRLGSDDEEGGFEWESILHSKPPSNTKVQFDIALSGCNLHYQPSATEQEQLLGLPAGSVEMEPRAEGSYEVYSSNTHNKYRSGKVCQLFKPLLIDANGDTAYADFNSDAAETGVLEIDLPDKWLRNAAYPVIVDPTAGWSTAGGTAYSTEDSLYVGHNQGTYDDSTGTLTADHTVDTDGVHAWAKAATGSHTAYFAVYENDRTGTDGSADALVASNSETLTYAASAEQYDVDVSNATLSSGTRYSVGFLGAETTQYAVKLYGTWVGDSGTQRKASQTSLPDPIGTVTTDSRRFSMWLTYTESGGEEEATTYSGLHTTDTVLYATASGVHNADTVLQATSTVTTDADSVLQGTSTVTTDADSILQATSTVTTDTDSVLQATSTVTSDTDTVLQATSTVTTDADSVLSKTDSGVHSTDGVLKATAAATVSTDSVLYKRTDVTTSVDSALTGTISAYNTTDCYIVTGSATSTHKADSYLYVKRFAKNMMYTERIETAGTDNSVVGGAIVNEEGTTTTTTTTNPNIVETEREKPNRIPTVDDGFVTGD